MKCLVLAAGMSTRLGGDVPKPLMPVGGVPVLHRNLRWLIVNGVREIYINLHYRADMIRASLAKETFDAEIVFSYENPILGTAGAAKKLESELKDGPFLVVYGDNVFNFDLDAMICEHLRKVVVSSPMLGTLAVFDREKNLHTGIAGGRVRNKKGVVTCFIEGGDPLAPGEVNAGCYVLEPGILRHVPDRYADWAKDIFPVLLKHYVFRSYLIDGFCPGIDTPDSYRRANEIVGKEITGEVEFRDQRRLL